MSVIPEYRRRKFFGTMATPSANDHAASELMQVQNQANERMGRSALNLGEAVSDLGKTLNKGLSGAGDAIFETGYRRKAAQIQIEEEKRRKEQAVLAKAEKEKERAEDKAEREKERLANKAEREKERLANKAEREKERAEDKAERDRIREEDRAEKRAIKNSEDAEKRAEAAAAKAEEEKRKQQDMLDTVAATNIAQGLSKNLNSTLNAIATSQEDINSTNYVEHAQRVKKEMYESAMAQANTPGQIYKLQEKIDNIDINSEIVIDNNLIKMQHEEATRAIAESQAGYVAEFTEIDLASFRETSALKIGEVIKTGDEYRKAIGEGSAYAWSQETIGQGMENALAKMVEKNPTEAIKLIDEGCFSYANVPGINPKLPVLPFKKVQGYRDDALKSLEVKKESARAEVYYGAFNAIAAMGKKVGADVAENDPESMGNTYDLILKSGDVEMIESARNAYEAYWKHSKTPNINHSEATKTELYQRMGAINASGADYWKDKAKNKWITSTGKETLDSIRSFYIDVNNSYAKGLISANDRSTLCRFVAPVTSKLIQNTSGHEGAIGFGDSSLWVFNKEANEFAGVKQFADKNFNVQTADGQKKYNQFLYTYFDKVALMKEQKGGQDLTKEELDDIFDSCLIPGVKYIHLKSGRLMSKNEKGKVEFDA